MWSQLGEHVSEEMHWVRCSCKRVRTWCEVCTDTPSSVNIYYALAAQYQHIL